MDASIELPTTIAGYNAHDQHAILLAAVEHENVLHPKTPIQVIKAEDLAAFLHTHQRSGRYHLIIEEAGHYFTVDLLQQGDTKSCIVLDPTGDTHAQATVQALENNQFAVLQAKNDVQTDAYNSALFALEHSIQFVQAPDELHTTLKEKAEKNHFSWDSLPPNFSLQSESINAQVFPKAQALYLKEKILDAMSTAIQETSHALNPIGKEAKRIELIRLKNEFEQAEIGTAPFNSPQFLAFNAAIGRPNWFGMQTTAAKEFRTQMQSLRSEQQAEQTANLEEKAGLDLT
jgi:hypothetical protein